MTSVRPYLSAVLKAQVAQTKAVADLRAALTAHQGFEQRLYEMAAADAPTATLLDWVITAVTPTSVCVAVAWAGPRGDGRTDVEFVVA